MTITKETIYEKLLHIESVILHPIIKLENVDESLRQRIRNLESELKVCQDELELRVREIYKLKTEIEGLRIAARKIPGVPEETTMVSTKGKRGRKKKD